MTVSNRSDNAASLVRNSVALAVPKFSGYVFSFISAPVVLTGLGLRQFGIWALTGALAQYGSLLDLGVGASLARFVAAHHDDRRLCGQYMAIGWISLAVFAAIFGPAAVFGAPLLAHALGGISTANMRIVLCASAALMCLSMATSIIAAWPIGLRRMVAPNIALTIGACINFVASVGSIALGAGLPGYALANAGAGLVSLGVIAVVVIRAEGLIPIASPGRRRVREFLSFSTKNQLVRMMSLVNYQTDKIVIAFAISPAAAGAYELANRVAIAVREVGVYATSAVNIELTALMARGGMAPVRARYRRLSEVGAAITFPAVILAMASAPLLLRVWLSYVPPNSTAVLVALSAAYLVSVSTGVGYAVAQAAGEPGIVASTAVGTAVANIVLTAALAPAFGIWGVLGGTVVALTGGAIAQVALVQRRFGLPASDYLDATVPALRVYALFAVPVALVSYAAPIQGRAAAAFVLLFCCAAYSLACTAWALRAGRLPAALASRLGVAGWLRASA
jgi:O-antigen/teichoic acid export membrane protein